MRRANDLKQHMRHRLDQILHSRRYEGVLQEDYFAQREGRYVVPIKTDMQGKIPGIVHDVSASGATVFLEPRELVELNNSIKVVDLEVEREVRRILRELSAMIAPHTAELAGGVAVLGELDAIAAKAGLSQRLHAVPPRLNDEGRVVLKQARHPFLVLTKEQVVPNDLALDETVRVLIISGPNTGGKTVTLKLLGLFSLMVRCGLHLPCAPESEMAIFPSVYADIGDAQDLARDLSSFSAHITQMVQLLREVSAGSESDVEDSPVQPGRALVLLDEPVTSTDPAEGAALASALLCPSGGSGSEGGGHDALQPLERFSARDAGLCQCERGIQLGHTLAHLPSDSWTAGWVRSDRDCRASGDGPGAIAGCPCASAGRQPAARNSVERSARQTAAVE